MPKVTVIPPSINRATRQDISAPTRRKVAAYARVSTDFEEQLTSYEAQISYYTNYIQRNPDWEFVKIYTDEGISATSTKHREGFNSMITDALNEKIDLIITKSVSRFARNTVDSLTTIRKLKEHHVECFFEKENIWTFDSKGELLITIMSSLAQEESRSASENRKWQIRKDFKEGKIGSITIFGYRRNADGILEIEPTEAEIVKMIFSDYLSGMGGLKIAKKLNEMGIRTAQGNLWTSPRIKELLSNEKYVGDMLLQKYFRNNHIEKRKMQNNGELPKYLVEDAHEAIIDRDTFQKVQELIAQRQSKFSHTGSKKRYPLSGMIQCGCRGKNYQRKVFKQGSASICATFARRGKKYCPAAKQIPENILQSVLCEVLELEKYDDDTVLKYIRQIIVPEPNELIFIFYNGKQVQKHWENPSRSESWTEEMKQKAKERSLQWHEKSQ